RVYRDSPGAAQMCDSCYSLVVTEAILTRGTVRLDDWLPTDPARRADLPGYQADSRLPYQLTALPGRGTYYGYPLGSSVASVPLLAAFEARGHSPLGPDGLYDVKAETAAQAALAAALAAAAVGLFLLTARCFLRWGPSLLVALGFAFASPAWST